MLGRYLRLYHVSSLSKWQDLMLYFGSVLAAGASQLLLTKVLGFEFSSFISYDTIFMFFGAVGLFMFFSKLNFTSRTINWLATFCLATYVIHLHPWTWEWYFQTFLRGNDIHGIAYLLFIFIVPFLTFAACVILEFIRRTIFRLFHLEN
jgi:hypothetical protein